MMLKEYETAVHKMDLNDEELKATEGFPPPVTYGFILAARKANHGRKMGVAANDKHGDTDWSQFFGKGFGG